jgi:hypothetical protein
MGTAEAMNMLEVGVCDYVQMIGIATYYFASSDGNLSVYTSCDDKFCMRYANITTKNAHDHRHYPTARWKVYKKKG